MSIDSLIHIPGLFETDEKFFNKLQTEIKWEKVEYFKRHINHYHFEMEELNNILYGVARQFDRKIEGVFLNYYENGNEFAPYHADKYNCDSVLVSFGTERVLRYKHNETKDNTDFNLKNGDVLYIPDEINKNYKHSLLKRTKLVEPRISVLIFLE